MSDLAAQEEARRSRARLQELTQKVKGIEEEQLYSLLAAGLQRFPDRAWQLRKELIKPHLYIVFLEEIPEESADSAEIVAATGSELAELLGAEAIQQYAAKYRSKMVWHSLSDRPDLACVEVTVIEEGAISVNLNPISRYLPVMYRERQCQT